MPWEPQVGARRLLLLLSKGERSPFTGLRGEASSKTLGYLCCRCRTSRRIFPAQQGSGGACLSAAPRRVPREAELSTLAISVGGEQERLQDSAWSIYVVLCGFSDPRRNPWEPRDVHRSLGRGDKVPLASVPVTPCCRQAQKRAPEGKDTALRASLTFSSFTLWARDNLGLLVLFLNDKITVIKQQSQWPRSGKALPATAAGCDEARRSGVISGFWSLFVPRGCKNTNTGMGLYWGVPGEPGGEKKRERGRGIQRFSRSPNDCKTLRRWKGWDNGTVSDHHALNSSQKSQSLPFESHHQTSRWQPSYLQDLGSLHFTDPFCPAETEQLCHLCEDPQGIRTRRTARLLSLHQPSVPMGS